MVASIDDPAAITPGEAKRVFDDLLEAIRIENCRWQPEIVSALLASAPSVIPAWGYGYRGAGQSHSVATRGGIAGIRAGDSVPLRWARAGDNPPNPFEQSDGRAYRTAEELVVDLAPGDWLEFELTGADDARVTDETGADAAVRVEPSARGIRVTATAPTTVSRIHPSGGDRTW